MIGTLVVVSVAAVPAVYAALRPARLRNFGEVRAGVLYRSGQLTPAGFERVLDERGIRTVISLRPERDAEKADTWEEDVARARGVKYVRVTPREHDDAWLDRMAEQFLAVVDAPANHPVLVHCMAGRDRTGTMCAIYRMEFDRWTAERAAAEMQEFEFDPNKDPPAQAYNRYVLGYRPRWARTAEEKK
ncbi:fused DSP-PTPase phosphatase/NAD kinase-like protein [Frigoriglobus tundricola]|nr:tyrosine-protein phosphatase [Frigoriglobus tundricola]